jgi:Protein of unknown function (DUF3034)
LVAATSDHGIDSYLSATKLYLAGPFSRTWLVNWTLRAPRAKQFGILGFGGDRDDGYILMGEGSIAMFLTDHLALGGEHRQMPDHLSAFREDDARDVFMSWFVTKIVPVTGARVDLGDIATHLGLRGCYVAVQMSF